jgi:hypothetical protein
MILGYAKDNREVLISAVKYLDSFGAMLPSMEANSERREEESLAIEPMTGEST